MLELSAVMLRKIPALLKALSDVIQSNGKRWRLMKKTENRQSHIIRCWSALGIILICSLSLKPEGLIKFGYTWQVLGIRYLEMHYIPVADHRLSIYRANVCMHKPLVLFIPVPENIWNIQLHCRNILKNCFIY